MTGVRKGKGKGQNVHIFKKARSGSMKTKKRER